MARSGTPHEGVDNILINAYTGLTLLLYTNAADSLTRNTVLANLTEPSALDDVGDNNGYAAVILSGVWSSANSIITYDDGTPDNVVFTNTGGAGNWNTVVGAAITNGTYLLHFKDFGAAVSLPLGGQLQVNISGIVNP